MSDVDTAAIRAQYTGYAFNGLPGTDVIAALCDALDAAWEELAAANSAACRSCGAVPKVCERAPVKCCPECTGDLHQQRVLVLAHVAALSSAEARAARAEAAIGAVLRLCDTAESWDRQAWTSDPELTQMVRDVIAVALDGVQPQPAGGPEPAAHEYLSTGCYHGEHGYCQSMTGYQGEKRPGRCKFCDARCTCSCHEVVAG